MRQDIGPGHAIVHERSRQRLAVIIEYHLLQHRLPQPLDDAAMHLARQQQRVHGHAEIVDDGVALQRIGAGVRVDLDLDDMAAVRKGLSRRHVGVFGSQRFALGLGSAGNGEQVDCAVGADDLEYAVVA